MPIAPRKVFIVNGGAAYRRMFESAGWNVVTDIDQADLIQFTGGEDVSPAIYGDRAHKYTGYNTYRDEAESYIFNAWSGIKPMAGICRGGQFLNVMNGGRMYQHVTNHTQWHDITDLRTGETINVSSTHHQMMMPAEHAKIIAVAHIVSEREWYDNEVFRRDQSNTGYEVVFYEGGRSLCFQPHPEFGDVETENMTRYYFSLIEELLF